MIAAHRASWAVLAVALPNLLVGLLVVVGSIFSYAENAPLSTEQIFGIGVLILMVGIGLAALVVPIREGRRWAIRLGLGLAAPLVLFWAAILRSTLAHTGSAPARAAVDYLACAAFLLLLALPVVAGGLMVRVRG